MSTFEDDLAKLSSAEDFFAYFGLDYDARVMAASRLHILKQFHDNLAGQGTNLDEEARRALYREQLQRAYQRFVTGNALTERVFPRLYAAKGAFVALSSLTMANKSGSRTAS